MFNMNNNMFNLADAIRNPDAMVENMARINPQFRSFVEENKNLSVEEIAKKYGVNISELKNMLGK